MVTIASIVSYHPDLVRLQESLAALGPQVDAVVIIDNGSANVAEVAALVEASDGCQLVRNDSNLGVAAALNQAFDFAQRQGAEWLLTLDQDSVCAPAMVQQLLEHAAEPDIAIICPRVIDRRAPADDAPVVAVADVPDAITSGSLTRVRAWRQVSGLNDWLFVDYVDHDFSIRLRDSGWRIRRVGSAVLQHELGNLRVRVVCGRQILVYNHSAKRKYFYVRNGLYLAWAHRGSQGLAGPMTALLKRVLVTVVFERNRLQKVGWMLRGTWDAMVHIGHEQASLAGGRR